MFWRRSLVSEEIADWVTDRFGWLVTTLGPATFFEHTKLVLPTRSFFATGSGSDEATASAIFDEVRTHMGVNHWPVRLVPLGTVGEDFGAATYETSQIAGTFYTPEDGPAVITYRPGLMRTPKAFIGTLAHELAHYILAPHVHHAPGGEEEHELLTDLTVIYAGMGVIDIQGARDVGWQGYLRSDTRAYALATFLRLKDVDPDVAMPFLDTYLQRRLKRALAQRDERADELVLLKGMRNRG
ncbi:hypothetical protein [Algicella marina]|uniref:Uncharacterized protein n=1 Tax=Algicella marina TaxID=2683284 RepID=A0A6P1SWP8_9RHOB|nr:hypothetical protein [Algicella marina]QHQ35094.1 hypothetical protein GO499_07735 [Algicella marina]